MAERMIQSLVHRATQFALILLMAVIGTGCTQFIEDAMIEAPNKGRTFDAARDPSANFQRLFGIDHQFRIQVGPPDASLLVWGLDPDLKAAHAAQPKGTILVLHGYRNEMFWMLGKARDLTRAGYRVFLVDLRGNGRSSGDWLTYGVRESSDLVQVIDAIEQRDLLTGDLGVWGISYGAATAIQLAGRDPRVKAVVAVAPFSSMRNAVPHFITTVLPPYGWTKDDADFASMIDAAAARAAFDPNDSNAALAAAHAQAEILMLHGEWDALVPIENSERIVAAAPDRAHLQRLPMLGHITIYFDPGGAVRKRSVQWFDRNLTAR